MDKKQEIIEEILRIARQLGTQRLTQENFAKHSSNISITKVRYHFGTWNRAIEIAGLEPSTPHTQRRNYSATDEEYLEEIIRVTELLGKEPTYTEFGVESKYSVKPYVARWGTFSSAKAEAYKRFESMQTEVTGSPTEMNLHIIDTDKNSIFDSVAGLQQYTSDVFMIMPFHSSIQPVYDDHIRPTVEARGNSIRRGDDFFSNKSIMADVWEAIVACRLVIAECTGRNPNVFYELGLAHALNKPSILLSQNLDDIPFDIRHLRVIHYEFTPRGVKRLEKELSKALDQLLG